MFMRLPALLLIMCLCLSFSGCAWFWGHDEGHPFSQSIEESKPAENEGWFHSERHFDTHWQIIFDEMNEMHRFFDRHFLGYDWDNPRY